MSLILLRGRPFSPREIAARMPCVWLEPRQGLMWQENTGVTPTTSGGQTVGLNLDLSQGLSVGPELVTNGNFSNDTTTGWSGVNGCTISVTGGVLSANIANVGSSGFSSDTNISTRAGRYYKVTGMVRKTTYSGTGVVCYLGGVSLGTITLSSSFTEFSFYALRGSTGAINIEFTRSTAASGVIEFDNLSVCEIFGNHASQSTAANRPIYQVDANGRAYLEHNSTQFLTASLPDLGGGVFSSNGSIYWVTPTGMQSQHGQAISTSLSLPAANTNVYSCLVTPERLNAVYENKLGLYFLRLAGLL